MKDYPAHIARVSTGADAYWPIGQGHLLVVGTTKAGKSSVVRAVCCSTACSPLVQVVGIDLKAVELSYFVPRLSALAVEPAEADLALEELVSLVRARRLIAKAQVPPWRSWPATIRHPWVVAVIDELAEVTISEAAPKLLDYLLRMGRALGIGVVSATQRAEAGVLGGAQARMLYAWRFAMASLDDSSYELGLGVDARSLRALTARLSVATPGLGLLLEPGQPVRRARAVWWTDAQVDRVMAATAHLRQPLDLIVGRALDDADTIAGGDPTLTPFLSEA